MPAQPLDQLPGISGAADFEEDFIHQRQRLLPQPLHPQPEIRQHPGLVVARLTAENQAIAGAFQSTVALSVWLSAPDCPKKHD